MRIVVEPTSCAEMGICEGIDPERFQIQADGRAQVLRGYLEDNEVLEVAREAGNGI